MYYTKQTYQPSGQRILRHIPTRVDVYSNAVTSGQEERDVTMIYPSGLITAKVLNPESWSRDDEPGPGGSLIEPILRYTKHYYIGSERISSATDTRSNVGYFIDNSNYNDFFPVSTVRQISNETVIVAGDALEEAYGSFGLEYSVPAPVVEGSKPTPGYTDFNNASIGRYFFHPDHLGSSSYITDKAGVVSQHMEYLPFGELLVDEHLNSHNSPFKFNAKELDPETGNYYYGARYYDPKYSIWLSVDPLAKMFPSWSPYNYTFQNPINLIDPTGMAPEDPPTEAGKYEGQTHYDPDTGATYEWDGQGAWHSDMGGENKLDEVVINRTTSSTQTKKYNLKDAIPCVQCHHTTTFSQGSGNEWDIFNLNDRRSGYVQYGGEMLSDFIGSSIGKDGVIYGSYDSPFSPSDRKTKIQLLKYLIDLKGGLDIGSQLGEALFRGEEDIDFRTFNYTTYDTIPTKWSRGSGGRLYRGAYRIEEKKLKGYIINNDTIK